MLKKWRSTIVIICLFMLALLSACGSQGQTQNSTVAQSQRDITYPGVGGVTLAGTLVIPAHRWGTLVPGVIFVAGSGPTARIRVCRSEGQQAGSGTGNAGAGGAVPTRLRRVLAGRIAG
jgi:hypothetical protein